MPGAEAHSLWQVSYWIYLPSIVKRLFSFITPLFFVLFVTNFLFCNPLHFCMPLNLFVCFMLYILCQQCSKVNCSREITVFVSLLKTSKVPVGKVREPLESNSLQFEPSKSVSCHWIWTAQCPKCYFYLFIIQFRHILRQLYWFRTGSPIVPLFEATHLRLGQNCKLNLIKLLKSWLSHLVYFWKAFCSLLGTTVSLTSGYHPQSNGQTERLNQELETGLRCLVSQNPAMWSKHLILVEYAHLPCSVLPLVSPLPSVVMSHHYFQSWRKRSAFLQPRPSSVCAIVSGMGLVRCCFKVRPGPRGQLIVSGPGSFP